MGLEKTRTGMEDPTQETPTEEEQMDMEEMEEANQPMAKAELKGTSGTDHCYHAHYLVPTRYPMLQPPTVSTLERTQNQSGKTRSRSTRCVQNV